MRTVGVEEELLLVDLDGSAMPAAEQVEARSDVLEHELKQEQVEIASDPHRSLAHVRDDLLERRAIAQKAAQKSGASVAAIGTTPLPTSTHQTRNTRYQRMADAFGMVAAQQLTCGQHVHVSIESRAEGVAVLDRIRGWLPVLRAISANSPFWHGADTDYASYRSVLWGQWPTTGPTEIYTDEGGYDTAVEALVATGAALDIGMIYFDARLSAKYQTVEIRVADACTDLDDALLITALCRAMVETAAGQWHAGSPAEPTPTAVLRAANWRAARYGIDGDLVHPGTGRLAGPGQVLADLVEEFRPALRSAGDERLVTDGLARLRRHGTGSTRQRAVYAESGDLRAVVDDAARRTVG